MKKIFKIIGILIGVIASFIIMFLTYTFVIHKLSSYQDTRFLKTFDTGKIITINNHKVNYQIFNNENTENVILFLGGSGVTDATLSLKPLADKLNAKVLVINRPGFGFSDDTKDEATIEYIIEFYRTVLKELNITDQIILMPHSISGMYAMYWAELYPDEIKSIIALDVASPTSYLEIKPDITLNILKIATTIGLHRNNSLLKLINYETAIKNYKTYDSNYFEAIKAMNNINPISNFDISENKLIAINARKTLDTISNNYKSKKKLFIIANPLIGEFYNKYYKQELGEYYKNTKDLEKYKKELISSQKQEQNLLMTDYNTNIKEISGPHCIYYYPSFELINEINAFLAN